MRIRTNNVPRFTVRFNDLTKFEQQEVIDSHGTEKAEEFIGFHYKGQLWSMDEFMRLEGELKDKGWDGSCSQSAFHGVLVKLVDDGDKVIVGECFS